jgi:long-chain acyl-CoA synthetase
VYPTISPTELEYVLGESEVQIVFVANVDIYERFKDAFKQIPTLKHVYSFDQIPGVKNWKELIDKNAQPDETVISRIKPETLATIIYTSGTTGNPKGVMLTHNNIVSNVNDSVPSFTFAEKDN